MDKDNKIPHTKVVFCGSPSVGKTTLLQQILKKDVTETPTTTMGVGFASVIYQIDDYDIPLNFWDTAGQEAYRSLVNIYLRNVEIAVIVYEITSTKSFEAVPEWIDEVRAYCGEKDPVICLVGNKLDQSENRAISFSDALQYAEPFHYKCFEVSAISNDGVNELMEFLGRTALTKFLGNVNKELEHTEQLLLESSQPKRVCC